MGKIRNVAISLSKKNVFLRKIIRGLYNCLRKIQYKLLTLGIKIDDKTIIFACFNGKSYSCSPKAIYEYMQKDPKYEEYKFIWAFKDPEKYRDLEKNNWLEKYINV